MPVSTTNSKLELAQISHELRNPIALISSSLQLLSKEHPEITTCHYWDSITEEISHLGSLLNDICSLQAGSTLFPEITSFHSFATNLLEKLLPGLMEKEQALCLQLPQESISIQIDRHKIRQVIENLIRNASDASPVGSTIYWKIFVKDNCMVNEITDQGSGIPEDASNTLFQPFVTTKPSGTGLGLPICKEIIENHDGCIYFHKNSPSGTTFGFRIPIP